MIAQLGALDVGTPSDVRRRSILPPPLALIDGRASILGMGAPLATVSVHVELPRDVLGDADPAVLSVELRRLWAVEQVRRHRFGVGKGAEVAEMPRASFMRLLGEHGVPVIDYPASDLEEELRLLDQG